MFEQLEEVRPSRCHQIPARTVERLDDRTEEVETSDQEVLVRGIVVVGIGKVPGVLLHASVDNVHASEEDGLSEWLEFGAQGLGYEGEALSCQIPRFPWGTHLQEREELAVLVLHLLPSADESGHQ